MLSSEITYKYPDKLMLWETKRPGLHFCCWECRWTLFKFTRWALKATAYMHITYQWETII